LCHAIFDPIPLSLRPMPRPVFVAALALALLAARAPSQEIVSSSWGFDGSVRTATYNLLTVSVRNPTADPWEDELVLTRRAGVTRVGLPLVQPVFLAPGQVRIVQFAPYVADDLESWSLEWRSGQVQPVDVPAVRTGQDGFVLLEEEPSLRKPIKNMPRFPARWWPATVAATDAVRDVVLDHVPDWDEQRREAFLDWVRSGGRLHVLRGVNSRALEFGDGLDWLDAAPTEVFATYERLDVGAGDVYRYPLTRQMIDKGGFRRRGLELDALELRNRDNLDASLARWRPDRQVIDTLRLLVRADHSWGLIFFCSIGFFVVVGPLHWWLARPRKAGSGRRGEAQGWKGLGWKASVLYLVASIAIFTWLFLVIGARGYGETTRLHTMGVARSLGEGRWDVDLASNLFVTDGDLYTVAVPGEQAVVSAGPVREPVRGAARSGRDAQLRLDVPLFSSRPFLRRSVLSMQGPVVRSARWPAGSSSPELEITNWPVEKVLESFWIERNVVRPVAAMSQPVGRGQAIVRFLNAEGVETWSAEGHHNIADLRLADVAPDLAKLLLGDALRLMTKEERELFADAKSGVLAVIAALPEAAKVSGLSVGEDGYVVYLVPVRPSSD